MTTTHNGPAVAPTVPVDYMLDRIGSPTDIALTLIARADEHGADARAARNLGDHALAGRFREEERLALTRAKLLVEIAQTEALDTLADSARRIALAL
jgi:hypothetical protein